MVINGALLNMTKPKKETIGSTPASEPIATTDPIFRGEGIALGNADLANEKEIRIKYQDIVYKICLLFDTKENKCGTWEVVDKVKSILSKHPFGGGMTVEDIKNILIDSRLDQIITPETNVIRIYLNSASQAIHKELEKNNKETYYNPERQEKHERHAKAIRDALEKKG